jgi:hypothetical protein
MSAVVSTTNGNLVVTVRITLVPGRDDDLISLVRSAPRGGLAATIREAMRGGVSTSEALPTIEEVDTSGLGIEI